MRRWHKFVLVAALTTSSAYAEAVGDCMVISREGGEVVSVIVNQRRLAGEELQLYLDTSDKIDAALRNPAENLNIGMLRTVLGQISGLPSSVEDDSKSCLRNRVSSHVSDSVAPGDSLVRDLMSSDDLFLERLSIDILLNQDTRQWFVDRRLRHLMKATLTSGATDDDVRVSILYLFGYAEAFSSVRGIAFKLARSESRPELARGAAQAVCWDKIREEHFGDLAQLFRSSTGILRQQAALALTSEDGGALATDLKPHLAAELIEMMHDSSLPAVTRGEAIEGSARLREDGAVVAALVNMLEPENWFFGAVGTHAPEHSLVKLVKVLADLDQPAVQDRLKLLKHSLSALSPADRRAVESELRWTIGE